MHVLYGSIWKFSMIEFNWISYKVAKFEFFGEIWKMRDFNSIVIHTGRDSTIAKIKYLTYFCCDTYPRGYRLWYEINKQRFIDTVLIYQILHLLRFSFFKFKPKTLYWHYWHSSFFCICECFKDRRYYRNLIVPVNHFL